MSRPAIVLDPARPIASLRELLSAALGREVTTYAVGKALGGAASACDSAERAEERVQLSTLVRAAEGLGYSVEVRLVKNQQGDG